MANTRKSGAGKSNAKPTIIPKIEATGPPAPQKQTGDLAQVSFGATGTETTIIGLMNWSIDWKRKTVDSTTTDAAGYAGKMASTAEWTASAEWAYIDGDPSQTTAIRSQIVSLQAQSAKFNFFNSPSVGRDSWSGNGWLTGIKITSGVGKLFGMNITIEGDGPLNLVPQLATTTGTASDGANVLTTLAED